MQSSFWMENSNWSPCTVRCAHFILDGALSQRLRFSEEALFKTSFIKQFIFHGKVVKIQSVQSWVTSVRWSLGASLGKNTLLPSEKISIRKSLILRNMNLHIIQMHATLSRWTTTKDQFAPDKSSRTVNWTRSLRISNSQLMASQNENKANQCNLHLGRRKTQTNVLSLQMRSFYSIDGRTVFENLIKSLIQHCDCEWSEQGLQYCQIGQFF